MSEIEVIGKFVARVERIALERFRENMKHTPYKRLCEYYPEAVDEVVNEIERACESENDSGLEDTEERVPGLRGSA
jgi:hypothetical protein